jgi:hypothetical protein
MLAAYAATFLQAGTQSLASPMKTDPQVILCDLGFLCWSRSSTSASSQIRRRKNVRKADSFCTSR